MGTRGPFVEVNQVKVAVIIPWRYQQSREYAVRLVADWYATNLPDATVVKVDSDDEVFNLSAARNLGVRQHSDYDVVILNDADTIPDLATLQEAIEQCQETGLVHLPYNEYRSLRLTGTQEYLGGKPVDECDHLVVDGACSGVYVTTPDTWWSHNGQDESFRGWGFEDAAWWVAHTTLLGQEPQRHVGRVYAFHHESSLKEGDQYSANAARCYEYLQAEGDVEAMRRLVFGDSA